MSFFLKVFFSSIEVSAMIMLALSLFRIPFKHRLIHIFLISVVMSVISFYFRDILNSVDIAIIPLLITEIILVMLVFNLVIYYSMLLCVIGYLASAIIEIIVVLSGSALGITSSDLIQNSVIHLNIMQITSTLFMLIIIYFLQSKKIGFMFVIRNLALREALKGYNFILFILLIVGIITIQFALISSKSSSFHFYILASMSAIFIAGISVAYKNNKKILKQKNERLSKQ
jgi:hypothetical protein